MEQDLPLSSLARLVASVRTRGLMSRLAVRNLERFGLVHLYFEHGRLTYVEGHLADPVRSIFELGTWQNGTVRQDSAAYTGKTMVMDPRLDGALDSALRSLVARGIVERASPPPAASAPSSAAPGRPWPTSVPESNSIGTGGLPPLSRAGTSEIALPGQAATELAQRESLTTPQWQLVALVIRQMVERMGQLIGAEMAVTLLHQSLVLSSRSNPLLHELEVEPSGWLKETQEAVMTTQEAEKVAEAVAALVTNFELRCASLVGKEEAHHVIASSAEPFRAALAQMGLDVSG